MEVLRKRLTEAVNERNAKWSTIELDYALSWVLAAVGACEDIRNSLIFKGGTCLKKCYFGQYRFSEDLDFTLNKKISDQELDNSLEKIVKLAGHFFDEHTEKLKFTVEPYKLKSPHPKQQKAYSIRVQFPWHRDPLTKIKFEISRDEILAYSSEERVILHNYGEKINQTIRSYSLEEILAEKFRGILQNQERLRVKGWIRSRVRDFYDLWHIFDKFNQNINLDSFQEKFIMKCKTKDILFTGPLQFFEDTEYLGIVEKDWDTYLGNLVADLPSFNMTIDQLKNITSKFFYNSPIPT